MKKFGKIQVQPRKGKNKRNQIPCYDSRIKQYVLVDSIEEVETYKWLLLALKLGIITDFKYQPERFTLSEPIKYTNSKGKQKSLFQEHVYSPDFLITINPNCDILLDEFKVLKDNQIYIDVKGEFARNDGGRAFSLNQKWMYQKYGLYIYKLIPKKFFLKMGIPEELRYTNKTRKPSKKFAGYPLEKDVFNGN